MTIEEKAEAYDKAIERVKKMFSDKEIEYLFPELKRNDDDVKLTIIQFLEYASSHGCPDILSKEKAETWIDWLEKQGEMVA